MRTIYLLLESVSEQTPAEVSDISQIPENAEYVKKHSARNVR